MLRSSGTPPSGPRPTFTVQSLLSQLCMIRRSQSHGLRCAAYDDGRTQLLLCLHGLLPISFRGASYNIPIAVWLPREYPRNPPIAYVVPTSDMLVRAGPDVDVSGRCSGQYLHNWERKSEVCVSNAHHDDISAQRVIRRGAVLLVCWTPCKRCSRANHPCTPNRRTLMQHRHHLRARRLPRHLIILIARRPRFP